MNIKEVPKISYTKWECVKDNIFQKRYVFEKYIIILDRCSRNKPYAVDLFILREDGIMEGIKYGRSLDFFYQLIRFLDEGVWSENIKKYKLNKLT